MRSTMHDVERGVPAVDANSPHANAVSTTGSAQTVAPEGLTHRTGFEQSRSSAPVERPPPSHTHESDVAMYFRKRAKDEGYNHFVLMVWGSEDSERGEAWAVDVPLTDFQAEDKAFDQLRTTYRKERGVTRSCLSLLCTSTLKPVQVRSHFVSMLRDTPPGLTGIVPNRLPGQRQVSSPVRKECLCKDRGRHKQSSGGSSPAPEGTTTSPVALIKTGVICTWRSAPSRSCHTTILWFVPLIF